MGTPPATTCGMKEDEMKLVSRLISDTLKNRGDQKKISELKKEIKTLAKSFQPYGK